ncbi:unnamed protein product [Clonostachys solani]|uniref:Uncharacterized protein n=1 Tax=Clonostachys solani TaxID=160281 RepID=A0A9N9YTI7_9HYPO|nr:unnamed protein product [Clonostachys solani]
MAAGHRRLSFTLSPASRATKRVMEQRNERRTSMESAPRRSSVADIPVVEIAPYLRDPSERWTCANRIG